MSDVNIEDILKLYKPLIDSFQSNQQREWSRWEGILLQRVAHITNGHMKSGNKREFWRNVSYFFLILSTITPIIVTIIIECFDLSPYLSFLDALFPVLTIIIQIKLDYWSKCLQGFSTVYNGYQNLLRDILFDISKNIYSQNEQQYTNAWHELNNLMQEYDILYINYKHWYN